MNSSNCRLLAELRLSGVLSVTFIVQWAGGYSSRELLAHQRHNVPYRCELHPQHSCED